MNADKAMAKLQTVSADVLQSSITLKIPLLSWQAPWVLDDTTKRAAKAFLNRVANVNAVWWDITSGGQQSLPGPRALNGSARADALIGVEINGHLVQVCPCVASPYIPGDTSTIVHNHNLCITPTPCAIPIDYSTTTSVIGRVAVEAVGQVHTSSHTACSY